MALGLHKDFRTVIMKLESVVAVDPKYLTLNNDYFPITNARITRFRRLDE